MVNDCRRDGYRFLLCCLSVLGDGDDVDCMILGLIDGCSFRLLGSKADLVLKW
jgi:hypothetical protein